MEINQSKQISVGMLSLGCPKTLVDSELILGFLEPSRFRVAKHITDCDIAILNTCAFIQDAKEESIDHILKLVELKEAGQIKAIIVLGCLVQRYHSELQDELSEIDAFLGTADYEQINEVLNRVIAKKTFSQVTAKPGFLYTSKMNRIPLTPFFSRYLKISEGCDHVCSFCTIPKFRGKHRSRLIEDIVTEARGLIASGTKELILTGQDTTFFGRDTHHTYLLAKLLGELDSLNGLEWIRLLYAYPSCVTRELIHAIRDLKRVCHYLDMPLQHVSDSMLQAMKRGTTKKTSYELIRRLRQEIPDLAIRTTFIVGFPGETDDDFKELLDFMEYARFERLGVFMYSQEEESASSALPNQVKHSIKEKRFDKAMMCQQAISFENNNRLIGKKLQVLIERQSDSDPNLFEGRSYMDAPEVDGVIYVQTFTQKKPRPGDFVSVQVTGTRDYDLVGLCTESEMISSHVS